jgi:ADP-ribose pyrophosphatase YjhB (NUDIX family)
VNFCPACGAAVGQPLPFTCEACGTPQYLNPRPTGCALVTHGGRLLLVRRGRDPWGGRWDIPGGFCDGAEHPQDAARREVLEEAGVECRITGCLGAWLDVYSDGLPTINAYFLADAPDATVGRPDGVEITDVAWFAPGDIDDAQIAFPDSQVLVLEAWRAARA